MSEMSPLQLMESMGVILYNGHYKYTEGGHGATYVAKEKFLFDPVRSEPFYPVMARKMLTAGGYTYRPDAVVGPISGGAIVANRVAYHLGQMTMRYVYAGWANKKGGGFIIRDVFAEKLKGLNVIVTEDVINTGSSVKKVIEELRRLGANVVGVTALVNRGGITAQDLGVPFLFCMVEISLETWDADNCPLCKDDVPFSTIGGHLENAS